MPFCVCCLSWRAQVELHEDIVKRLAKLFKKIDLDGDGNLEREEIFKFCGGSKQFAADLMFDLDEDQDGQVTMDEWLAYFAKLLAEDGMEGLLEKLEQMESNLFGKGLYDSKDMDGYDPAAIEKTKKAVSNTSPYDK